MAVDFDDNLRRLRENVTEYPYALYLHTSPLNFSRDEHQCVGSVNNLYCVWLYKDEDHRNESYEQCRSLNASTVSKGWPPGFIDCVDVAAKVDYMQAVRDIVGHR